MDTATLNGAAAAALVRAWVAGGVRHAVLAPGSRSTPLALALARDPGIALQVVLDERSAAFRALGIGRATGTPAVVACTSGTAAAHFHAAVIEAHHACVPMIVATADRPPELRDSGAGQTIDQVRLYGAAARWFVDAAVPDSSVKSNYFAHLGARAVATAIGGSGAPGPVHVNLPFREPLLGASPADLDPSLVVRASPVAARPADDRTVADIAARVRGAERGIIVIGWGSGLDGSVATVDALAQATGWPVLADTVSGARVSDRCVTAYEALLRDGTFATAHRPDLVVRFGAPLTSKVANAWLDDPSVEHIVVDPYDRWLDPTRRAALRVVADGATFAGQLAAELGDAAGTGPDAWLAAETAARQAIDARLDADDIVTEPRVARDVVAHVPDGAHLLLASSMPVRDAEWFAPARSGVHVHANRGANGIDGLISTAVGIAVGSQAPTIAVLGDLAFLHDAGGLLGAATAGLGLACVFVVIDNGGGGIFSFLPQADLLDASEFDALFTTPQSARVADVARGYGLPVTEVTSARALGPTINELLTAGGAHVLRVETDRAANVALHRELWATVAATLPS